MVEPGTSTLATGIPRVNTPWNRNVPRITWLILQRLVEAPPQLVEKDCDSWHRGNDYNPYCKYAQKDC